MKIHRSLLLWAFRQTLPKASIVLVLIFLLGLARAQELDKNIFEVRVFLGFLVPLILIVGTFTAKMYRDAFKKLQLQGVSVEEFDSLSAPDQKALVGKFEIF